MGKLAMNTIHDEMGKTSTDDYISTKSRQIKAQAIGNNRGREQVRAAG